METNHFYIALFFHLVSLIVGFGAVIVIDTFGLLMLLKKVSLDQVKKTANITQPLIWIGWTGMVISGINLITLKGYVDSLTAIKLFLVFALGINGIFLHNIKKSMEKIQTLEQISKVLYFRITLASAISQTGWWGALAIGFVHRHIQHNIPWPSSPWPAIVALFLVFLTTGFLGEIWFRRKPNT